MHVIARSVELQIPLPSIFFELFAVGYRSEEKSPTFILSQSSQANLIAAPWKIDSYVEGFSRLYIMQLHFPIHFELFGKPGARRRKINNTP